MRKAVPSCFSLERQDVWRAFSRAWAKTGNRIAARIAMIAITTRSSMRVNPLFLLGQSMRGLLVKRMQTWERQGKREVFRAFGGKTRDSPYRHYTWESRVVCSSKV